ncbi:solute carrier family 22 member 20-like [Trichosurus vulpecula]|uniref:solute carrier family 22 member 20-like n=1 Tax=Trichosurus vulpecula TaxID=9337 RepID=UPI00186AED34|nr:solute carrier family 22 member 20-like [Trichosurus vulpecula]
MGRFQILQTALLLIPGMLFSCHVLIQNFIAVVPEHHCRLQNQTSAKSPFLGDGRDRDLLQVSIPMDKSGKPETCLRFTEPQWQFLNPNGTEQASLDTEDCLDGWVYDKSVFSSSIVIEWDLVCERKSLPSIAQAIYVGGQQAGSVVFGILSDRFGRRTVLLWSSLMAMIAGACAAFVPTFAGYVLFRFLTGAGLIGIILTRNCLTLEWTPPEKRILVTTCNAYAFPLGAILLSGWAYLVREWRWLQFSTSVSFGISLLLALYVDRTANALSSQALPESARWLITHNNLQAAVKTLQKVAWINGQKEQGSNLTPEVVMSHIQEDLTTVKPKYSLRDLFQTPGMCKMTLCVMFGWFACGFSFYGMNLDLQKYGFSIYLVQVLFALIDFPTRLLGATSMSHLGNRFTFIFCAVFSGCMIILGIFVPQDMAALRLTLGVLGKGSLGTTFFCVHLYTFELYPTEIRQRGMSVGMFSGRIGALMTTLVFIIGSHSPILQPLFFGIVPILSAIGVFFLTETHGLPLLETIQETENRMKRAQSLTGNASEDVQERPALLIPEMPEAESTV